MPLLLQRYARFTDSVIYLGADMENKKLKKEATKLNSKHNERRLTVGFPPNQKYVTVDEAVEMLRNILKRHNQETRKGPGCKLT